MPCRADLLATGAVRGSDDGHLTQRRLGSYHRPQRENTYAASRTAARLRAELERSMKQISRQVRALKQSPHFKA